MLTDSDPADSSSSNEEPFAITRVVDCEPPARDVRQCRPAPTAVRRRTPGLPQRPPPVAAMPLPMRQAATFADAALRRVLEVIDRRRPIAQLNGLLAVGLVDSVLSANRLSCSRDGVAVLRRVRLQPAGPTAAEVFGSYSRGPRTHAIACRLEARPTPDGAGRWQVVALHIG